MEIKLVTSITRNDSFIGGYCGGYCLSLPTVSHSYPLVTTIAHHFPLRTILDHWPSPLLLLVDLVAGAKDFGRHQLESPTINN